MRKLQAIAAASTLAVLGCTTPATGQGAPPEVRLYALECGSIFVSDLNAFSDTEAYPGMTRTGAVSCWLIKHGDDWMLWDTGLPDALAETPEGSTQGVFTVTVPKTLASQIEALGLSPDDVDIVAISHAHFDHTGNAPLFASAKLLIQKTEWDAAQAGFPGLNPEPLAPWVDSDNLMTVQGDHDVFGDGTVKTIFLPGHTPGHQGLLVNLENAGPVILSGDQAHFAANWETRGVPDFNSDRADTLASFDKLEKLIANLDARLILQHDAHLDELPEYLD